MPSRSTDIVDWAVSEKKMRKRIFLLLGILMFLLCDACMTVEKDEITAGSTKEEKKNDENEEKKKNKGSRLLYMGQASIRIITPEGT